MFGHVLVGLFIAIIHYPEFQDLVEPVKPKHIDADEALAEIMRKHSETKEIINRLMENIANERNT